MAEQDLPSWLDPFAFEVWARTGWMEARGEPEEGRRAVLAVMLNRYHSGRFGRTLTAVCLQDQAFSCWNAARDDTNREQMAVLSWTDPLLAGFRALCRGLVLGELADPTFGATHYFDARLPSWPAWAEGATLTCQLGHHRFYKDVP